jgi:hypothetical protein
MVKITVSYPIYMTWDTRNGVIPIGDRLILIGGHVP